MDLEKVDTSKHKIIVGLDFGTTYSGLAWAETRQPGKIASVTTWPISENDLEAESSGKCPTTLRYAGESKQWGFSIPATSPDNETIAWFKL